jgi:molybdopterin synthase catalytic subunit
MLRELLGADRLDVELPDGASVADLLASLPEQAARLPLVVAVNRQYAKPETILHAADEVALVPPVSGGSDRIHVSIVAEPLSVDDALARVRDPAAGAEVVFLGLTREIAEQAVREHGLCAAVIVHRVGSVPLSEPSIVVAASSPHRPEAFAGARAMIDAAKARAPIWKRESEGTEQRWVPGQLPDAPA